MFVGHHSEKRHRRDIERMENLARKSLKEAAKAEYYRGKAAGEGTGGISGNDETALDQLREKRQALREFQNQMKEGNKIIRKAKGTPECKKDLLALGLSENDLSLRDRRYKYFGREESSIDLFNYHLKNNLATTKSTQRRITELEQISRSRG